MERDTAFHFDFEEDLQEAVRKSPEVRVARKKSYRRTVCRHWLRGLCMKGDDCDFLHQYDQERMPVCRFYEKFGDCHDPDCIYKHSLEDIKECFMYKSGFCPNGPDCRYRHKKLPGPPPSLQNFQNLKHRARNQTLPIQSH